MLVNKSFEFSTQAVFQEALRRRADVREGRAGGGEQPEEHLPVPARRGAPERGDDHQPPEGHSRHQQAAQMKSFSSILDYLTSCFKYHGPSHTYFMCREDK